MTNASAVLIGSSRLLTGCADKLVQEGVEIVAVASTSKPVKGWAAEHGVRLIHPDDLYQNIAGETFDYLLSVVNLRVLEPQLLELPQIAAINFHDGPLPLMGGAQTPAWAVFEGQEQHASTWHLMVEQVDAGTVLAERWFPLHEHSTAMSAMFESMGAAAAAFDSLIPAIVARQVPSPLQLPERQARFFSISERFAGGGVIHAGTDSKFAARVSRALDFGSCRNPLGLPTLVSSQGLLYAKQIRSLPDSGHENGDVARVVSITRSAITLATRTGRMALSDFQLPDGATVSGEGAAQRIGAVVGQPLLPADHGQLARIADAQPQLRRFELGWRRCLESSRPLRCDSGDFSAATAGFTRHDLTDLTPADQGALAAAFLAEVATHGDGGPFDFAFSDSRMRATHERTSTYAVARVPVRFDPARPQALESGLREASRLGPYASDLEVRTKVAPRMMGADQGTFTSVMLLQRAPGEDAEAEPDTNFALLLVDGEAPAILTRLALLDQDEAATFVDAVLARLDRADHPQARAVTPTPTPAPDEHASGSWLLERIMARAADPDTKDQVALEAWDQNLTYAQLVQRSAAIAADLANNEVGPGDIVGLLTDRDSSMVPAMLATLRLGAGFLPLQPDLPAARIRRMLELSGCRTVLHSLEHLSLAAELGAHFVALPREGTSEAATHISEQSPIVPDDATAYVLFTSGSSGDPKGVQITTRALSSFASAITERLGLAPGDRFLAHTTAIFDISLLELLVPLASGGVVVLAGDDQAKDPAAIAELTHRCTHAQATPSLWRMVTATGWRPHPDLTVLCGGEAFPADLLEHLSGGNGLWNMYGPTEATIWVSATPVDQQQPARITDALEGVSLHVLEPGSLTVRDIGEGELCVSGPVLAKGYVAAPAETDRVFVTHPTLGRIYRTGDLVNRDAAGQLTWLARVDTQLKVRGHRIEAAEVESALTRLPGITAAAVIAAPFDGEGAPQLVAYVTAAGQEVNRHSLIEGLNQSLPASMIPDVIVALQEMPLTANGKIARRELPTPSPANALLRDPAATDREPTRPTPASDAVETVGSIFGAVLGRPPLGPQENFFDHGGDSLKAGIAAARVSQEVDSSFTTGTLFATGTPQRVADLLEAGLAPPTVAVPNPTTETPTDHGAPPHEDAPNKVAAVALSCRFPGADCAEDLWELLLEGTVTAKE